MATLLTSCSYDQFTLNELSDNQLIAKRTTNQRVGYFMLLLLVLIVGMAAVLDSYLVAVTSWAIVPALNDYSKKRKAINKQLQSRNMA